MCRNATLGRCQGKGRILLITSIGSSSGSTRLAVGGGHFSRPGRGMSEITLILDRLGRGESDAFDDLVALVYQTLRFRAYDQLQGDRMALTLQPTALVHEALLKLMAGQPASWENSRHFYNAAAQVMRHIVLNHARANFTRKRGGDRCRVQLDGVEPVLDVQETDWEGLDAALDKLKELDGRRHQVVMLRYFGGLTDEQIARALDVSDKTVRRDWAAAKAFLRATMSDDRL